MTNYIKTTDFASKDALPTGNPAKTAKGAELGAELDNISTAISSKEDSANKGPPNGYAGLDSSSRITNTIAAASQVPFRNTSDNFGYLNIPQNSQTNSYTLVLTDAGTHILHPSGAGSGDVYTIPSNASVAFPVGTTVTFVNLDASNNCSIAITTDTLTLAGTSVTGTRTLLPNGIATAVKVTSTQWLISGAGLL